MCELPNYCCRVIRRARASLAHFIFFTLFLHILNHCFFFFFFPCNWFSLYGTSPAPTTNFTSYVPMTGSSLTPPASSVATPSVPSITVSSHLTATSPSWMQPSSPRYRPYTVAHSGGFSASSIPRSLSISIPSSSPSPPAMAASPPAMPVIASRQRPTTMGPPLFTASPSTLRRRSSLLNRIPSRYFTRTKECV